MASAVGRVGPVPEPAAAKACRLGEVEGVPEKRGCEADGGETVTRLIKARIPGGEDVGRQCPSTYPRIGGEAGEIGRDSIEMKPSRSLATAPIEIAEARACQPCRQSAELLHRDRVAHTGRQWKGKGETGGACAPQNEPATADGRHPVVPSRKCPTHYASHPHRRQQKGRGMTAPESAAIASP